MTVFEIGLNYLIIKVKLYTKDGFSLLELILVISLSGMVMGGLITFYQSITKETSSKMIHHNNENFEIAPSLKAAIDAFEFHQTFLSFLEKATRCLCFGGVKENDYAKDAFLPINSNFNFGQFFNYKPLMEGKVFNHRYLIEGLESQSEMLFEKNATKFDFTCVLLSHEYEKNIFVQLRSKQHLVQNTLYRLYSIIMSSLQEAKELRSYRFAVKVSEDSYAHCDTVKRFFWGNRKNKERFDIIIFPDPCLVSNNPKSDLKSLSRFTYILDGF